jgi:hypothetical protein
LLPLRCPLQFFYYLIMFALTIMFYNVVSEHLAGRWFFQCPPNHCCIKQCS